MEYQEKGIIGRNDKTNRSYYTFNMNNTECDLKYKSSKSQWFQRMCSWNQKSWYGLGHVYNDLCAAMWFSYMLLFFKIVLKMEATSAGAMLMLGQVVDALATPVVGLLADRVGDKKMWYLTGTTLVSCTFPMLFIRCFGCWTDSIDGSSSYLEWWMPTYYAILIIFFQIGWAFVQISHLAMIPAFTDNLKERSELTSIRYTASVCSSITVYIITWLVLKSTNYSKYINPSDDYKFTNVTFIITLIGITSTTLFFTKFQSKQRYTLVKKPETNGSYNSLNSNDVEKSSSYSPIKATINYFLKSPFLYYTSMLYVCSRLYWALTLVYIPLYLDERLIVNLDEGSETVATVPLVLYISSFFASLILKYKISSCGNQLAYLFGTAFSLVSCLWIGFIITPESSSYHIYGVAIFMGAGSSITMVASLCITSDLIGPHVNQGAVIYSIVTFTDKLVTGVAVVAIENFKCASFDECPQYYRSVLSYVCGSCAVLGLVSLLLTKISNRRVSQ